MAEVDAAGSGMAGGILTSTNVGQAKKIAAAAQVKSQWKIDSSGVKDLRREFQGLLGDLKKVREELTAISKLHGGGGGSNGNGGGGRTYNNGGSSGGAGPSGLNVGAAAVGVGLGLAFNRINRGASANVVSDAVLSQYAAQYGGSRNSASAAMTGMGYGTRVQQLDTMAMANQSGMGGASFGQYSKSINQIMAMTGNTDPSAAASSYMGFSNPQTSWAGLRFGMSAAGTYNQQGGTNDFGSIVKSWGTSGLIGAGRGSAPTVAQMSRAMQTGSIARSNLSASGITGQSQDDLLAALQINAESGNGGTGNFVDFSTKKMKARLANATGKAQGAASTRDETFLSDNYAALVDGANAQKKSAEYLASIDRALHPLYSVLGPLAPLAGNIASLGKTVVELAVAVKYLGIGGGAGSAGAGGFAARAGLGGLGAGAVAGTAAGAVLAASIAQGASDSRVVDAKTGQIMSHRNMHKSGSDLVDSFGADKRFSALGNPLVKGLEYIPGSIVGIGRGLGNGLAGDIKSLLGDAVEDRAQSKKDPGGFKPEFRRRLNSMMTANPRITITGGSYRSAQDQIKLFTSRYYEDPNGSKSWNGKRWSLKKGMAPAATPGHSLHETGQAADLGPSSEWAWIAANAEKYGLDIKSGLSIKEPWHVQLVGATSGGARGSSPAGTTGLGTSSAADGSDGTPGFSMATAADFSSSMSSLVTSGLSTFAGGAAGGDGGSIADFMGGGSSGSAGGAGIQGLIAAAKAAGFTGQGLVDIVAIGMRESKGNANAFNGNAKTGDKSYGYTQINMLGKLGSSRLKQFGLSSADQLFDPVTNMKAAFQLSNGGKNFDAWGRYKGMDPFRSTDRDAARAAIGDASEMSSAGGMGSGLVMHNHFTLHVMNSSPAEAERVAQMIGANLEHTVSLQTLANR